MSWDSMLLVRTVVGDEAQEDRRSPDSRTVILLVRERVC